MPSDSDVRSTVEAVARKEYGRLIAYLSARTRDVAGAEDALSDALIAALTTWPRDGVPRNPQAWLLTAARNRMADRARHIKVQTHALPTLQLLSDEFDGTAPSDAIQDERLKLMFVCAHPAIDADIHTPLMLQAVLGLDAAAIARAFLVSPQTMSQRLVRAKKKIRDAGIAFELPEREELPQRLDAVLNAIYAAYGSGWEAAGVDPRAQGLTTEAIWLARVLRELMPEAEVRGLLALMLHCEARREARRDAQGQYIPLSEQDPQRWNVELLTEAERELAAAARSGAMARFQLEAAIQSVHAERARTGTTHWPAIAAFYQQLLIVSPTLGGLVAHAAAMAEVHGATRGVELLNAIDPASVLSYQPFWAVRAHLLNELHEVSAAQAAYDRAIGLAEDEAVRRFLLARRQK
jgi:predicted RNA polymerase sigma factor